MKMDEDLVIPDKTLSINEGAIKVINNSDDNNITFINLYTACHQKISSIASEKMLHGIGKDAPSHGYGASYGGKWRIFSGGVEGIFWCCGASFSSVWHIVFHARARTLI